ncbi:MAG TPA: hypothetical protein PKO36_08915 [Candidatus Hydrogenedentes bacterium]|nr:hypothetical protein [Candidatus Hydrogenedentota bacterium]HOV75021.1 hypothetical protein [Candidatus Hydrogenedentota bacterium]
MLYGSLSRWAAVVVAPAMILMVACAPPVPPPTVAEPSAIEIAGAFRQALYPITSLLATTPGVIGWGDGGRGAPAFMTDEIKASVVENVRQVKDQYSACKHYAEALNIVNAELEQSMAEAESQFRWRTMMGFIEAYETINPGTLKIARLKERAQIQLNCPEVALKGFFIDKEKNDTYAFFHLILHPGNEEKRVQARVGDEFYGLRFVEIIGKRRGAVLEYLAVPGQTFRVMGP